ncbi:hypothetical protein [Lysinibacillus sp. FSL L8-0126]|uniref:hypothetical protein n=1 Tax=Lysinibacillus sp. FSL L8-0126 TaxID=2921515 RepID=UPI00315A9C0B
MQYNELGQEIERILPGDVISKWQYDITGRPTHHRVSSQNREYAKTRVQLGCESPITQHGQGANGYKSDVWLRRI